MFSNRKNFNTKLVSINWLLKLHRHDEIAGRWRLWSLQTTFYSASFGTPVRPMRKNQSLPPTCCTFLGRYHLIFMCQTHRILKNHWVKSRLIKGRCLLAGPFSTWQNFPFLLFKCLHFISAVWFHLDQIYSAGPTEPTLTLTGPKILVAVYHQRSYILRALVGPIIDRSRFFWNGLTNLARVRLNLPELFWARLIRTNFVLARRTGSKQIQSCKTGLKTGQRIITDLHSLINNTFL